MKINEIIKHEQDLLKSSSNIRKSFLAKVDLDNAKRVWFAIGNRLTDGNYIVDGHLKAPIVEILKWCIMDESFNGDLQKGLLLSGKIGCGKTLTLKIFVEFMKYANKIVASYSAIEVVEIFKSKIGKDRLFVSPLFIDDLGTEEKEINNFGTKEKPIYEIFNRRYLDRRFLMFITTNLGPSKMELRYGDRVRDRIKEMFNVMPIEGESRRK